MSDVGHTRRAGAEEGAGASGGGGSEEVAVVVGLFGAVEPMELG